MGIKLDDLIFKLEQLTYNENNYITFQEFSRSLLEALKDIREDLNEKDIKISNHVHVINNNNNLQGG